MSHLRRYSRHLTIGLRNELTEQYSDWKKQIVDGDPESAPYFRTLEKPQSWNELFEAMNELGFTQSDVLDHAREHESRGEHALANAIRQAADSESAFKHMEFG